VARVELVAIPPSIVGVSADPGNHTIFTGGTARLKAQVEGSPPFGWVNELLGKKATDGSYVEIAGTVANGSSTVTGSKSWGVGAQFPEWQPEDSEIDPINVTINWSFQHTGPITLPHD